MVSFVASSLIALVLAAAIIPFRKRRPVGTPLTWGEAMAAAVFVFFLLFWAYGVVPNQWLLLADNEWGWRSDKMVYGPGGVIDALPFDVNYVHLRDLVAVVIYGMILVANVALWMVWQGRGKEKAPEVPTSSYGRPLVRSN
ncbi:MAG: hypothetical protein ACLFWR_11055 [Acidimicrobiales bacterium]